MNFINSINLIRLIIVYLSVFNISIHCLDYCDIEKDVCGHKQHVACKNHNFKHPPAWYDFELIDITSKLRSLILEDLNEYRNRIALGKVYGFPRASNMAMLLWHHEFELIMEESVKYVEHTHFLCVATERFKNAYETSYLVKGNFTPSELITRALNTFKKKEMVSPEDRRWSSFYLADNYKIGCAYGTYMENGTRYHTFKCLTNRFGYRTLSEAYEPGDPCTKCRYNEICNDFYSGLCVRDKTGPPGISGPPGPRGPPGDPGPSRVCVPKI